MRTVWQQLLDRLAAGEVTICADEVPRWDKNQWEEVLGLGLLRETELAGAVVCDQCGDGALGRGLLGDAWGKGLFRV